MFAIYDTMQAVRPDVATWCMGQAASAAAIAARSRRAGQAVRAAERPGADPPAARAAWRDSRPTSRSTRRSSCGSAVARRRSSRSTRGQTVEQVTADTDRDYILAADEAKAYGLIDEVVTDRKLRVAASEERTA